MNKRLLINQIIGFVFVSIAGTLFHFLYDWLGKNIIVGMFCPINESPWEHMKLLFFPFLIYTLYTYFKFKNNKFNIFFSAYIGVVVGISATLIYFYTINGAIGGNNEWVNISSFFIGVAIIFIVNYVLVNNSVGNGILNGIAVGMLIVTCLVFFAFTFKPPMIELFKDPITLTYGI